MRLKSFHDNDGQYGDKAKHTQQLASLTHKVQGVGLTPEDLRGEWQCLLRSAVTWRIQIEIQAGQWEPKPRVTPHPRRPVSDSTVRVQH